MRFGRSRALMIPRRAKLYMPPSRPERIPFRALMIPWPRPRSAPLPFGATRTRSLLPVVIRVLRSPAFRTRSTVPTRQSGELLLKHLAALLHAITRLLPRSTREGEAREEVG